MDKKTDYERVLELEQKIYFAVYPKPLYVTEIVNFIWPGKDDKETRPQTETTLKKLVSDNLKYIKKLDPKNDLEEIKSCLSDEEKIGKIDKRYIINRSYYKSNPNFLLNEIKNKLNNVSEKFLSQDEERILEYFLSHDAFRIFIGATLFREENEKIVYFKKYATLDSIIQYIAVISSYTNVSIKTSGKKILIKDFNEFKIRFNKALKEGEKLKYPGLKRSKSDALNEIYKKCQERIEKKITEKMFSDVIANTDKAVKLLSDIHFFEAFAMLGSELLDKLARISVLNDWIKLIHISSATTSILQTFICYNVNMPQPTKGLQVKDEGPPLIEPIKLLLKEFKQKAEGL